MADIITGTTTGFVNNLPDNTYAAISDVRREAAEHTNELSGAVKDSRHDITSSTSAAFADLSRQVDAIDDTLTAAITTVSRDTMDLRSQVTGLGYQVRDGFTAAAKDSEINALKTQVALAQQTTYLSDKIDAGNSKTQDLINNLKTTDLNRMLIERNAEIVEERGEGRRWRGNWDQSQFQGLTSQLQAFQSQLSHQIASQGTVNFGSMSGNAGRNTSTNNIV